MGWWRRRTLRVRLALLSAVGLAVGLAAGGLLIIMVLHYVLIHSVDSTTRQTARDVSSLVTSSKVDVASPIPTAGISIVQVITEQQQVVAGTEGADRMDPMLTKAQQTRALNGEVVVIPGYLASSDSNLLRVVGRVAVQRDPDNDGDGGTRIILVAAPTHAIEEASDTVENVLLVVYPLLVILLSTLAWLVVGWALRPVEALRRGADQISAGSGSVGPLPVPDGDDEVHRLAVTLNDMLDRLEAGRLRQRAFVADAAHELRSPITSLRTQLEVAAHLDEPAINSDLLDDVARLGRLVDDLLLLARADEGDPKLRSVEVIDLAELTTTAVDSYVGARVPVIASVTDPVWTLGEPVAVRRILDNVITNAVRHAATIVMVSAVSLPDDHRVRVTVVDDGPGIPAEDRERVFDRFTRLDNARNRDQGGAGLGLAIVRQLLRSHQGAITLSDADPGLRVDIDLMPASAPGADDPIAAVEVALAEPRGGTTPAHLR